MMTIEAVGIGHNKPPFAEEVRERNKDIFGKLDELAAADNLVPAVIKDDDEEGKAQDLVTQMGKALKIAEAMHKDEKEPFNEKIRILKATFAKPMDLVETARSKILQRLTDYKEKKAADERLRREEEARKQREEAERLAKVAAEAEAKRLEAERLRREEERKAEEAEAAKKKALEEARAAEERARKAKEEAAKLEEERKAREARAAEEEKRRWEQAERDAAAEAVRLAQQEEERKAHEAQLAKLKAEREAEETRARELRDAADKARKERIAAEEAAAEAKRAEKAAAKDERTNLNDALRVEKRADRLDGAANASLAELSRGRGDYGSVGSLQTHWKWRIIDREKIPLETLRPYLHPDAVDAAITRFMHANRPQLVAGRTIDNLLPGVIFEEDASARVVG